MKVDSLHIHISTQRLDACDSSDRTVKSYPISSARLGLGSEPGSMKTPLGRFAIAEKIGAGAELGMIFQSRAAVGRIGSPDAPDDFVQTRILWLAGLEPQNENTQARYIYLHGTNQEPAIGWPTSHGCIRLLNADVAELFDLVTLGTPVAIHAL